MFSNASLSNVGNGIRQGAALGMAKLTTGAIGWVSHELWVTGADIKSQFNKNPIGVVSSVGLATILLFGSIAAHGVSKVAAESTIGSAIGAGIAFTALSATAPVYMTVAAVAGGVFLGGAAGGGFAGLFKNVSPPYAQVQNVNPTPPPPTPVGHQ